MCILLPFSIHSTKHLYTYLFMQLSNLLNDIICIILSILSTMQDKVHIIHQNGGKCDLHDFDHGMIVGVRQTSWSIYVTADLLGF